MKQLTVENVKEFMAKEVTITMPRGQQMALAYAYMLTLAIRKGMAPTAAASYAEVAVDNPEAGQKVLEFLKDNAKNPPVLVMEYLEAHFKEFDDGTRPLDLSNLTPEAIDAALKKNGGDAKAN